MLSEKKIAFEVTEIDLKNKPACSLKVSPYGKVPVLLHDGEVIYESAVINEYLDEARGGRIRCVRGASPRKC